MIAFEEESKMTFEEWFDGEKEWLWDNHCDAARAAWDAAINEALRVVDDHKNTKGMTITNFA